MKKILTLAFVALATMISSCNKDEKGTDETKATLEGTWQRESSSANGIPDSLTDCDKKTTITFTANTFHTERYEMYGNDCVSHKTEGSYTISGNTITTTFENKTRTFNYSISGNRLTTTGSEGANTIVIVYVKK